MLNVRGMHIVTVGGFYIGSVDEGSANALGLTTEQTAMRWAGAIREAVADRGLLQEFMHSQTNVVNTFSATIAPDTKDKR